MKVVDFGLDWKADLMSTLLLSVCSTRAGVVLSELRLAV